MAVSHYILRTAKDSAFTEDVQDFNTGNVTSYTAALDPDTHYYSKLKSVDMSGSESEFCATIDGTTEDTPVIEFRLGTGSASDQGLWVAETGFFSGGSAFDSGGGALELNEKQRPGRPSNSTVYQHNRIGSSLFTFTKSGLTPGANCLIRVHAWDAGFSFRQSIEINGVEKVADYVVQTYNGAANHVGIKEMTAAADGSGNIVVGLIPQGGQQASICALEIYQPIPTTWKIVHVHGDSITEGGGIINASNRWIGLMAQQFGASTPNTNWGSFDDAYDETLKYMFHVSAQSGNGWVNQTTYVTDFDNTHLDPLFGVQALFAGTLGVNDLINSPSLSATDIEDLITAFWAEADPAITYRGMSTILPSTSVSGGQETKRLAVNAWILANSLGLDMVIDAASVSGLDNPSGSDFQGDGLHPNASGQSKLYTAYKPFFDAVAAL